MALLLLVAIYIYTIVIMILIIAILLIENRKSNISDSENNRIVTCCR
jgi:preprotein translocase subunit SecG